MDLVALAIVYIRKHPEVSCICILVSVHPIAWTTLSLPKWNLLPPRGSAEPPTKVLRRSWRSSLLCSHHRVDQAKFLFIGFSLHFVCEHFIIDCRRKSEFKLQYGLHRTTAARLWCTHYWGGIIWMLRVLSNAPIGRESEGFRNRIIRWRHLVLE